MSKAESIADIEQMVSKETEAINLKHDIHEMIMKDGGKSGLASFGKLVAVHSDPEVLTAIRNGTITEADIATEMSRIVLDEVALAIQAHWPAVDGFYQAKKMESINAKPSTRTVIGTGGSATTKRIESVMQEFPNAVKLHRKIMDKAFYQNDMLGCKLVIAIKKSGCKGLKRRNNRHAGRSNSNNASKNNNKSYHGGHLERRRHKVRGDTYRRLLSSDDKALLDAFHRSNELRGIPRHPGAIENYGGSSLGTGGWGGWFETRGNAGSDNGMIYSATAGANAEDYERYAREEPPSMGFAPLQSKLEPPSLEPHVKSVPAPLQSKLEPVGMEVPSLEPAGVVRKQLPAMEPYVKVTSTISSTVAAAAAVKVSTEVPSLEPRKVGKKLPSLEQAPVSVKQEVMVEKETNLPSLANFETLVNMKSILAGPTRRVK